MKHLDQLSRKCRHDPKMGGNAEMITLSCTLVARLIVIAQAWDGIGHLNSIDKLEDMDRELIWADDEAKAWLEKNR